MKTPSDSPSTPPRVDSTKWPWAAALFAALWVGLPLALEANFGLTETADFYVVNTGADLIFNVNKSTGDIRSLLYRGVEYQSSDRNMASHIASGFGAVAQVSATTYGNQAIRILSEINNVSHYLMVRNGDSTIYMATYLRTQMPVGELRWITRLRHNLLPHSPVPSDLRGNTGAVESSDVFGMADGTIRSKYYGDPYSRSKDRAFEMTYSGIKGENVGVWMVFDNRESSAGGPFFRDIQNQNAEVYNYMNSGHAQTEPVRTEVLHGPYALVFNDGARPSLPLDYSWIEQVGIPVEGWVPLEQRGRVSGMVSGTATGFSHLVGFSNSAAQYWAEVQVDGSYLTPPMKAGVYQVNLWRNELSVRTSSVTVAAGSTVSLNLAALEPAPTNFIFKIGDWDGTPNEFLNADKLIGMHPGDVRMDAWGPVDYRVEEDDPSRFPAIQFRQANSPTTLRFTLTAAQASQGRTLRIGITAAYNNGRPRLLNVNNSWDSPCCASPSSQPSTRTYTLGTYRGNNHVYTYSIPASVLVPGENSLEIHPISGSGDLGTWLSAGWAYDAIQLDGPPTLAATPREVTATPAAAGIDLQWIPSPNAVHYRVERSARPTGGFTVLAGDVAVAKFSDSSAADGRRYFYRVTAINGAGQSEASAIVGGRAVGRIAVVDNQFAYPSTTGQQYGPRPGSWTFSTGAGVAATRGTLAGQNPAVAKGFQVGFLQGNSLIQQELSGFLPSESYVVTFSAAQRATTQDGLQLQVRNETTLLKSFSPAALSTNYEDYSVVFTASAPTHSLLFRGRDLRGDGSVLFLNDVRVSRYVVQPGPVLYWRGNGSTATWDLSQTDTWIHGGVNEAFTQGAIVIFDDTGDFAEAVVLDGTLEPGGVFVTGSRNYQISGGAGSLAGGGDLFKEGSGVLTLGGEHTYTGRTEVAEGVLHLTGRLEGSVGVGVGAGALLRIDGGLMATKIHNSGTIRLTGNAELEGELINEGLLDLMTWTGTLPDNFVNNGVVLDRSAVKVDSLVRVGDTLQITIQGYSGYRYELEERESLSAGEWSQTGATHLGAGSPITFTTASGWGSGKQFFRVRVTPDP